MSAKKILVKTKQLLSPDGAWGQHAFAYDNTATRVPWEDKRACTWCLEGGIKATARRSGASRRHYDEAIRRVTAEVVTLGFYGTLQGWNDRRDTDKNAVLALVDRAIAKA